MKRRFANLVFILVTLCLNVSAAQRSQLVIYISVDQMRADYLQRFKDDFTGGFKRMLSEGAVFTNANLDYAPSETGPGHAALGTGCYPWKSGILSNNWIDPRTRKSVYCVQDTVADKIEGEGGGESARNLRVTAIGDWLQQASPDSKVIAVSLKDRAAILMGGSHPLYAYWYDHTTGHMVTSGYYTKNDPAWVTSFNKSDWIGHHLPEAWTRLKPQAWYDHVGPDDFKGEKPWNGTTTFPHTFRSDKKRDQILSSPYGDLLLLDFALDAIRSEQLGSRGPVDLLCISLSSNDYIGHAFGPNSQEMADEMIRLDQSLGRFLDEAERAVGKDNIVVALSADHAVMPLPEYTVGVLHQTARRISIQHDINPKFDSLDHLWEQKFGTSEHIILADAFLNYAAASNAGVDSVELEKLVRESALKIDGIADIYFRRELINPSTPDRPYLTIERHGYYPPRGEDFVVRFCEHCLVTSSNTGTSHGSPYMYDTQVPVVLWGTGIRPGTFDRPVHSADVAPTLITLLGYSYPPTIDGVPLKEIVH